MSGGLKCAVTGANGYVGSIIAGSLRAAGVEVVALARRPSATVGTASARFVLGEDIDARAWDGVGVLIHAAYDFMARSWDEIERSNVAGALALFESARKAGVKRLIFVSSMSAFAGCPSLYGRAKRAVEAEADRLGLVVVRPGLVYGNRPGGMVGALKKLIGLSPVLPLVGRGNQILHVSHEDDLGRLFVRLATMADPPVGMPLIAANEQPQTFRRILELLAKGDGKRLRFVPVPVGLLLAGLRSAEAIGLRLRMRADSLIGLIHQDPHPDFTPMQQLGERFRGLEANEGR